MHFEGCQVGKMNGFEKGEQAWAIACYFQAAEIGDGHGTGEGAVGVGAWLKVSGDGEFFEPGELEQREDEVRDRHRSRFVVSTGVGVLVPYQEVGQVVTRSKGQGTEPDRDDEDVRKEAAGDVESAGGCLEFEASDRLAAWIVDVGAVVDGEG